MSIEDIDGVRLVDLRQHFDDRGYLFEVMRASDPWVPQFGQAYVCGDPAPFSVRAFHRHKELHDWFCVLHGSAKFALVDGRSEAKAYVSSSDDPGKIIEHVLPGLGPSGTCVLSARAPQLLVVPPGVFHGWMSLEPDTILLSLASHEYNRERPDEERVPPDHFDAILGGTPWRIVGR